MQIHADLVTFTEEIINGKHHFLRSGIHTAKLIHCCSGLNILREGKHNPEENSPRIMQSINPHFPKYVTNSHLIKPHFSFKMAFHL